MRNSTRGPHMSFEKPKLATSCTIMPCEPCFSRRLPMHGQQLSVATTRQHDMNAASGRLSLKRLSPSNGWIRSRCCHRRVDDSTSHPTRLLKGLQRHPCSCPPPYFSPASRQKSVVCADLRRGLIGMPRTRTTPRPLRRRLPSRRPFSSCLSRPTWTQSGPFA